MSKLREVLDRIPSWKRRYNRKFQLEVVRRMNQLLEASGMTQKELAEKAKWTEGYVSRILSGSQNLTLKTLARFEDAVGDDVVRVTSDEKYVVGSDSVKDWIHCNPHGHRTVVKWSWRDREFVARSPEIKSYSVREASPDTFYSLEESVE